MKTIVLMSLALLLWTCRVQGQDNETVEFPNDEITTQSVVSENGYAITGYHNITESGFLIGSPGNMYPAPFSFMTINAYQVTNKFSVGAGVGIEFLAESYMPVFMDFRYYIRNQQFSPFIFLQGGYSLAIDKKADQQYIYPLPYDAPYVYPSPYYGYVDMKPKGGWLLNPGVGVKSMLSKNFGLIFSAGYRLQRLEYDYQDAETSLEADYNRLSIKLGVIIK